jgi:hypothetical protein
MLDAHLAYFKSNYEGNRAPLHIGHHFFDYQGGVYREALMAFATAICLDTKNFPDVKCVTYSELAKFLDALPADTLAAYQRGDFSDPEKAQMPRLDLSQAFARSPPLISVKVMVGDLPFTPQASVAQVDHARFSGGSFEWERFGRKVAAGPKFNAQPRDVATPLKLIFRDASGKVRWQNTLSILVSQKDTRILVPQPELDR